MDKTYDFVIPKEYFNKQFIFKITDKRNAEKYVVFIDKIFDNNCVAIELHYDFISSSAFISADNNIEEYSKDKGFRIYRSIYDIFEHSYLKIFLIFNAEWTEWKIDNIYQCKTHTKPQKVKNVNFDDITILFENINKWVKNGIRPDSTLSLHNTSMMRSLYSVKSLKAKAIDYFSCNMYVYIEYIDIRNPYFELMAVFYRLAEENMNLYSKDNFFTFRFYSIKFLFKAIEYLFERFNFVGKKPPKIFYNGRMPDLGIALNKYCSDFQIKCSPIAYKNTTNIEFSLTKHPRKSLTHEEFTKLVGGDLISYFNKHSKDFFKTAGLYKGDFWMIDANGKEQYNWPKDSVSYIKLLLSIYKIKFDNRTKHFTLENLNEYYKKILGIIDDEKLNNIKDSPAYRYTKNIIPLAEILRERLSLLMQLLFNRNKIEFVSSMQMFISQVNIWILNQILYLAEYEDINRSFTSTERETDLLKTVSMIIMQNVHQDEIGIEMYPHFKAEIDYEDVLSKLQSKSPLSIKELTNGDIKNLLLLYIKTIEQSVADLYRLHKIVPDVDNLLKNLSNSQINIQDDGNIIVSMKLSQNMRYKTIQDINVKEYGDMKNSKEIKELADKFIANILALNHTQK